MPEKIACPACGADNYSTDRQCLSCGARLAAAAPAEVPVEAPKPLSPVLRPDVRKTYDDRSWWRRRVDDVIQYQVGGLIGMVAACLALALLYGVGLQNAAVGFFALIFFGLAAYCFVWYVRDPDSIWPLVVCIIFSSLIGWLLIALGAFGGAALEKRLAKDTAGAA